MKEYSKYTDKAFQSIIDNLFLKNLWGKWKAMGIDEYDSELNTKMTLIPGHIYAFKYNAEKPTKFVSFPKYEYFIADKKYAEISRKMGFKAANTEEGVNSLIEEIKKLNKDLGIESSFKEAGIDEKEFLEKLDMLADRAFEDQCTTANPRLPLVSELKQIMLDSYYGNE